MRFRVIFPIAAALCMALAGCGAKDPMAETGDLWPNYYRYPTGTLPTADEIERACFRAEDRFKEEAEKQGVYSDPEPGYIASTVRRPRCDWERGAAVTASCNFEMAPLYARAGAGSAFPYQPGEDEWTKMEGRFVRVRGPVPWIPPKGCRPVPRAPAP